jgi:DNA repair exonuclease SbcCD nuclease subunit
MEKAIVFSDLHVHNYRQFNEGGRRLKNGIAFLDYIFKLADANNIRLIIMPGDLHNLMQIVSVKAVNAVVKCLKKNFDLYPQVIIVSVSGNHDYSEVNLLDKPAESALEHLAEVFPRFILLDYNYLYNTKGGSTILGIPYYEHKEHFISRLSSVEIQDTFSSKVFLLIHQTIGSGLPIEDTIEPTDPLFDNFSLVLNGHIHNNEQLTDKFINIGSPISRDAGDIGKQKGFWIVDLDNPVETIAFKDITDKFPQFIHKTQGEELTEWESQQYVIWIPAPVADSVKDAKLAENFSASLTPSTILQNYCNEVVPDKAQEYLEYGLKLLLV